MEPNGWIEAAWEISPTNRKARYYALTPEGRKKIRVERARWQAASIAVTRIMGIA
jgi:DNA-binding PadR family transcriptional regulator